MDAELRKKWVAALRSGKYTQGSGALKELRVDGTVQHCCLGVLCEVQGRKGRLVGGAYGFRNPNGSLEYGYPPDHLRELSGLSPSEQGRLARMNDNGKSFEEIADYIEQNL